MKKLRAFLCFHWGNIQRYRGLRTGNRRHFVAAEQLLTHALEFNEKHHQARINRGLLRWRELDNWAGAISDFTLLLAQWPQDHLPLFYRGMAFCRAGDYHAALHDLDAFIQAAPSSRWVYHATLQINGILAIIDELPKMLNAPQAPLS